MAYQMHWWPMGLVCPHCEEVAIIRYITIHQEKGITIHAFCESCVYAEGPQKGQNITFNQPPFSYDFLIKTARDKDDRKNGCVSDVDELAGYEQQMHEFKKEEEDGA